MNDREENNAGVLEVICGPMFCGKTEELIRRVRRAVIAGKKVVVFKHELDKRYRKRKVSSHDGVCFAAKPVSKAMDILKVADSRFEIVAIDEAQWFKNDLIPIVLKLLAKGKRVILAGLSTTYEGEPFEPMPHFMAIADSVTKLSAICNVCGKEAVFHIKKERSVVDPSKTSAKLVGGVGDYEARCRGCFGKSR